jgi:hypothetical protein
MYTIVSPITLAHDILLQLQEELQLNQLRSESVAGRVHNCHHLPAAVPQPQIIP